MEKPFDYKHQTNRDFYNEKDDDEYIHLTHSTRGDPKSIMEHGLLSGHNRNNPMNSDKNYGSSAGVENSFIWADHASKPHHRGTRVLLKLPKSKYKMEKLNDSEYGIYGDIDPEDIYGFDYENPIGNMYLSEFGEMVRDDEKSYAERGWDFGEQLSEWRRMMRDRFPKDYGYSFDDFMRMTPYMRWEDDVPELFGRNINLRH